MANYPVFEHRSLPQCHVRLLHVYKAQAELKGDLVDFPVDDYPDYQCISYSWGVAELTHTIICNDAAMQITKHLYEGLRCAFVSLEAEWLWIDAICINQSDPDEKAAQVAQISRVFSEATKVIVWLGAGDENTELALQHVPILRDKLMALEPEDKRVDRFTVAGIPSVHDPVWIAVASLYSRDWFRRLWVLQEVVLAQETIFLCGLHVGKFQDVVELGFDARAAGVGSRHIIARPGFNFCADIDRILRRKNKFASIPWVIHAVHTQYAYEAVDKVYAVMGLLDAEIQRQIVVDYSDKARAQYWNIYVDLFSLVISRLGPPAFRLIVPTAKRSSELPSWCPDLRNAHNVTQFAPLPYKGACRSLSPLLGVSPYVDRSTVQLHVRGLHTDIIDQVLDLPRLTYYRQASSIDPLLVVASEIVEFEQKCSRLATNLRKRKFFTKRYYANALVAGCDESLNREYPQDEIWEDCQTLKLLRLSPSNWEQCITENTRLRRYLNSLRRMWSRRCFFSTEGGRLGLAPHGVEPGDIVCIFPKAHFPYILRRKADTEMKLHMWIGEAYVNGLMNGEIFEQEDKKALDWEDFIVV